MSTLLFHNELGNPIEAKVWTNGQDDPAEFRLTLSIAGPTSTHENTVTEREAFAMHALLSLALFGEPIPESLFPNVLS